MMFFSQLSLVATSTLLATAVVVANDDGWQRHCIDRSSRGADGVRLGDLNGDGLADVVTGWEEGGVIRAYLNPGPGKVTSAWPMVTVGRVRSPEDATFVDLDGDGALDVVSCCEGKERSVFVHWAPKDPNKLPDGEAWKTAAFPAAQGVQAWMYSLALQVDGKHGTDLVIGSKGNQGSVSWLEAPANPRDLAGWKLHRLRDAGWIMSLEAEDVDADGRTDIVFTDRKGKRSGAFWLKNPGDVSEPWSEMPIGSLGSEAMFLSIGDLDGNGTRDIAVSTRNGHCALHYRKDGIPIEWQSEKVPLPFRLPWGKSVAIADIDGDGRQDLVTTNRGEGSVHCVAWQRFDTSKDKWSATDIGGLQGQKFDLIQPIDLDGDGDLDILTCEERDLLGIVWFENPRMAVPSSKKLQNECK